MGGIASGLLKSQSKLIEGKDDIAELRTVAT